MSDYISHDLQALILKWLPVKSLFRFKCVSKSWKLLIETDRFALDHLSVQNPLVIVQNQTWNDLKIFDPRTLPFCTRNLTHPDDFLIEEKANPYDVVNTLRGVICLYDYTTGQILLWNPSIRRFLTVPLPSPWTYGHKICGFWIEPCNKHFKVLFCALSQKRQAKAQAFALYSSRDQVWNKVSKVDISGTIYTKCSGLSEVLIDGVVHWMALRYFPGSVSDYIVVFFDYRREKLGIIELPEELQPKCCYVNLCKWQGSYSVVRCKVGIMGTSCCIWAMRNGSWSKMLSFDIIGTIYQVFCVLDDSGRVLASAWNGSDCELVLCDSKCSRQIHMQPNIVCKDTFSLASDFVESLVFPDPNGISSGY